VREVARRAEEAAHRLFDDGAGQVEHDHGPGPSGTAS
jgi:hypothetical protein